MTKSTREPWSPSQFKGFRNAEYDSCGIIAVIEKERKPTKENIQRVIDGLVTMNHRAGFINNEGDGVGIQMDIPVALWKEKLRQQDKEENLVDEENFSVGHFFIEKHENVDEIKAKLRALFQKANLDLIYEGDDLTVSSALGPKGKLEEPHFWQIALLPKNANANMPTILFDLSIEIEKTLPVHVSSLSNHVAIYKVMGAGDVLPKYYKDLSNPLVASTMTLGHNRYSTNTLSNFFRVQPFSVLGHNGEINTIAKLRDEAEMLEIPVTDGGSDSQDLNRTVETLILKHGYSLFEALEILFPPIVNEIKAYPKHLQDLYTYIREAWGHFAQGPAGIISRYGDEAVFSVDALGLRPVWQTENETSYYFASEQGILPSSEFVSEPKSLAPGEKIALKWEGNNIKVFDHDALQEEVFKRMNERLNFAESRHRLETPKFDLKQETKIAPSVHNGYYAAFGWDREHIQLIEQMAEKGVEPIRSLGHDAPLAALHPGRMNVADFIKESVAVVTNPAIDRDREMEHFSTRVVLGKRPSLFTKEDGHDNIEIMSPIVFEGISGTALYKEKHHPSFEQLIDAYRKKEALETISITFTENESVSEALDRLVEQASNAIDNGAVLLVLDDEKSHQDGHLWLDPHLVTSAIDQGLKAKKKRRECSILLRSAAIRSLHDLIVAFGLGADAINPYLMTATVVDNDPEPAIRLFEALNKGLEKVISTIGIHELRGYGRLFSAIGLNNEIAEILNIVNFLGSDDLAYNFEQMKQDSLKRVEDFGNEKAKPGKSFHISPRIWKSILAIASGQSEYKEFADKLEGFELNDPVSIRHLADLKTTDKPADEDKVDISVKEHSLPFVISSMSFGSQNEIAFRAYAEAADRLNMVSLNGEGGEIKDMLGKYPRTRGQQIASGRFGVNIELLHSSNLLEIKIGQGAKPGEGGHLPGSKVTDKVAAARNATKGSDLISPSNNHDIYSIEDLAQVISEIKTANDQAKVAVKVPVVPNIGTIAVGIAKAGADIITISGFDGGTGAARVHALQHVGLPVEIGVKAAHNALIESGLRSKVEIWGDGGIRSALDVIKIMLLGANRVGFGTLSMIAIGCTACKGCHLDTCHVGIATQIESEEQAKEHGLRRFVPRQFDQAVQGLINMFTAFGNELKKLTASLGFTNLQELVGRSDLLVQTRGFDQLHLQPMLETIAIEEFAQPEVAASLEGTNSMPIAVGAEYLDQNVEDLHRSRQFSKVTAEQRVLASRVAGHRVRGRLDGSYHKLPGVSLRFKDGSIPGNGLGAYNSDGVSILIEGGAQDGTGKTAFGGSITVLKTKGKDGRYYNGSVGKGFAYGAQAGLFMIQGNADSRAGIRLSGADIVFGGQVKGRVKPEGNVGNNANIKGFAFEYMTNGRGIVLGDPGPWICAGMTGGVVYLRHQPEVGLTKEVLEKRIAKGAKVNIVPLSEKGVADVKELLTKYHDALLESGQTEEAATIQTLLEDPEKHFLQVNPVKEQADPSVSTE